MKFNLLADRDLPELASAFPSPFKITRYQNIKELQEALPYNNILLCRSTLKVDAALFQGNQVEWVLTASSGRCHIDELYLKAKNTKILDAKGSNANAVVDYVSFCLAALNAPIKDIGIIGYGEVGSRLYKKLLLLGYTNIITYDPFKKSPNARDLDSIFNCDLVCIHPNLHKDEPYPSYKLVNALLIQKRKPHQIILNAARGNVVDEEALLKYHQGIYITDVYANEPNINPLIINHATIATPHIAGHTIEAKIDSVRLLSIKLHKSLHLPCPNFTPHEPTSRGLAPDPP